MFNNICYKLGSILFNKKHNELKSKELDIARAISFNIHFSGNQKCIKLPDKKESLKIYKEFKKNINKLKKF